MTPAALRAIDRLDAALPDPAELPDEDLRDVRAKPGALRTADRRARSSALQDRRRRRG